MSEKRLVDIETGERVEIELDGFIAKCDKQRRRDEGERAAEALERLRISEGIREDILEQTYPLWGEDLETARRFEEVYGQLPPVGYFRRLWWWVRGGS